MLPNVAGRGRRGGRSRAAGTGPSGRPGDCDRVAAGVQACDGGDGRAGEHGVLARERQAAFGFGGLGPGGDHGLVTYDQPGAFI